MLGLSFGNLDVSLRVSVNLKLLIGVFLTCGNWGGILMDFLLVLSLVGLLDINCHKSPFVM